MKSILASTCILITGLTILLCGCSAIYREKGREVDFTLVSQEEIPEELFVLIEEKKGENMELWYQDGNFFYMVRGYGEQPCGGYSIAVKELRFNDREYFLKTELIGPGQETKIRKEPSFPYVVLKTEQPGETVIFE